MVARWDGVVRMGKKGEKDYEVQIVNYKNSHRVRKYNMRNIVNNIVMTICGARGYWTYQGDHFVEYIKA